MKKLILILCIFLSVNIAFTTEIKPKTVAKEMIKEVTPEQIKAIEDSIMKVALGLTDSIAKVKADSMSVEAKKEMQTIIDNPESKSIQKLFAYIGMFLVTILGFLANILKNSDWAKNYLKRLVSESPETFKKIQWACVSAIGVSIILLLVDSYIIQFLTTYWTTIIYYLLTISGFVWTTAKLTVKHPEQQKN